MPEASRISVLRNGNSQGLKGWMPLGGQTKPSAAVGNSAEEKNAQKNAAKNITSDAMNSAMP